MITRILPHPLKLMIAALLLCGAHAAHALCLIAVCTCTVTSTPMAFGSYNPLAFGNTDTTATVTFKCGGVAGLLVPFVFDLGKGGSGSYTSRKLYNGTKELNYNIYTDATYTTVWGDTTAGTSNVGGGLLLDALGLSPGLVYTLYGRIPGRQLTVSPGVYTDSVTVTVTYQ